MEDGMWMEILNIDHWHSSANDELEQDVESSDAMHGLMVKDLDRLVRIGTVHEAEYWLNHCEVDCSSVAKFDYSHLDCRSMWLEDQGNRRRDQRWTEQSVKSSTKILHAFSHWSSSSALSLSLLLPASNLRRIPRCQPRKRERDDDRLATCQTSSKEISRTDFSVELNMIMTYPHWSIENLDNSSESRKTWVSEGKRLLILIKLRSEWEWVQKGLVLVGIILIWINFES